MGTVLMCFLGQNSVCRGREEVGGVSVFALFFRNSLDTEMFHFSFLHQESDHNTFCSLFIPAPGVRSQHFLFPCLNSVLISGRQQFWQCHWLGLQSPVFSGLQLWPSYMVGISHARLDPSPDCSAHIQDQDNEGKKYPGGFSLNSYFSHRKCCNVGGFFEKKTKTWK